MRRTCTRRCVLLGVTVALLSASCFAAVGDLEYAKTPPPFGRGMFVAFRPPKKIKQADKLKQLGAAEAVVGEAMEIGIKISAVVIRTKADTEEFDTIRVNMTGKGNFRNAVKLALKTERNTPALYYAAIEPGQATLNKDGKDIPVTITGYYYVSEGQPQIRLTLSAAVEGTCAFGKDVRKVRILDTTGDLKFGGRSAPRGGIELLSRQGERESGELTSSALSVLRNSDKVQVANGKGRFDSVRFAAYTPLGQPVQVGRKWFLVRVVGMKVSAEPLEAPMGRLAGLGDNRQVHLMGKKYVVIVNGAAQPVPLPADTYHVIQCIYFRPDKRGQAVPAVSAAGARKTPLEVARGQTAKIKMGLPMMATVAAKVAGGKVAFSVTRVDAVGNHVRLVMNAAGRQPKAPAIDVVDKTGKVVYTAQLEYG